MNNEQVSSQGVPAHCFKSMPIKVYLRTEEYRKRMSETAKRLGFGKWMAGRTTSEKTKRKIIEAMRGKKNPFWGKHHTKETKEKISIGKWKGDRVGYGALHDWKRSKDGYSPFCEHCGEKGKYFFYWKQGKIQKRWSIQWANKSRLYLRDLNDWLGLCASCHKKYDRSLI